MMILIAGPYRSGTGDDPEKMAANLAILERASLPIFERGHVPMIGEWAALPIWRQAGGTHVGDEAYERIMHPTAHRLLQHCDGVLRLEGASTGADNDVRIARERGIPVYFAVDDIPRA
ncbi:MAG: DUF4406 domain-containing protein [Rhizobiaceae bacterium]|nr:DUF4406 domain-containing protein [Rhizobiaceae bacterium]